MNLNFAMVVPAMLDKDQIYAFLDRKDFAGLLLHIVQYPRKRIETISFADANGYALVHKLLDSMQSLLQPFQAADGWPDYSKIQYYIKHIDLDSNNPTADLPHTNEFLLLAKIARSRLFAFNQAFLMVKYKATTPKHIIDYAVIWDLANLMGFCLFHDKEQSQLDGNTFIEAAIHGRDDLLPALLDCAIKSRSERAINLNTMGYGKAHITINFVGNIILTLDDEYQIIKILKGLLQNSAVCRIVLDIACNNFRDFPDVPLIRNIAGVAIVAKKFAVLEYILQHEIADHRFITAAAHVAVLKQDMQALQLLCKTNLVAVKSSLITIAQKWHTGLEILLEYDNSEIAEMSDEFCSVLDLAVDSADINLLKIFIKYGANLFVDDQNCFNAYVKINRNPALKDALSDVLVVNDSFAIDLTHNKILQQIIDTATMLVRHNLFAHVHNDHAMLNESVEGATLAECVRYLSKAVAYSKSRSPAICDYDALLKPFAELQENEDYLAIISAQSKEEIKKYHTREMTEKTLEKNLATFQQSFCKKLFERSEAYLGGGWQHAKSAHAVIYKFAIEAEKTKLYIFNSGSGIAEFHEAISDGSKKKYASYILCELPGTPRIELMEKLVVALMIINYQGFCEEGQNSADYSAIIKKIQSFGFGIVSAIDESRPATMQRSGTCAWKASKLLLRESCSEDVYVYLNFIFKMHSLTCYLAQTPRSVITQIRFNNLESAIENFARFIAKHASVLEHFDPAALQAARELRLITQQSISIPAIRNASIIVKPNTVEDLTLRSKTCIQASYIETANTQELYVGGKKDYDFQDPFKLDIAAANLSLQLKLLSIRDRIDTLREQNRYREIIFLVQHHCIEVGLQVDYDAANNVNLILELIEKTLSIYRIAYRIENINAPVINYITCLTLCALSIQVGNLSLNKIGLDLRNLSDVIDFNKFVEIIDKDYYLFSSSPILSTRYNLIKNAFVRSRKAKNLELDQVSVQHGIALETYREFGLAEKPNLHMRKNAILENPDLLGMLALYHHTKLQPEIQADLLNIRLILNICAKTSAQKSYDFDLFATQYEYKERATNNNNDVFSIEITYGNEYSQVRPLTDELSSLTASNLPHESLMYSIIAKKPKHNPSIPHNKVYTPRSDLVEHNSLLYYTLNDIESLEENQSDTVIQTNNQVVQVNALLGSKDIDQVANVAHTTRLNNTSRLYGTIEYFNNHLDLFNEYSFVLLLRSNFLQFSVQLEAEFALHPGFSTYVSDFFIRAVKQQINADAVSNNGVILMHLWYDIAAFVPNGSFVKFVEQCRESHQQLLVEYSIKHPDSPIYLQLLQAEIFYYNAKAQLGLFDQQDALQLLTLRIRVADLEYLRDQTKDTFEKFYDERIGTLEPKVALVIESYLKVKLPEFISKLPSEIASKIDANGILCYPFYKSNGYVMDMCSGVLTHKGMLYKPIPKGFLDEIAGVIAPNIKYAFVDENQICSILSADKPRYKFGNDIYVGEFCIQLYSELPGFEGWYYNSSKEETEVLPAFMRSKDHVCWIKIDSSINFRKVIVTRANSTDIQFSYDGVSIVEYSCNATAINYILFNPYTTALRALDKFESAGYIKIVRAINNPTQITIELIRYNLLFELQISPEGKHEYVCCRDPRYKLKLDAELEAYDLSVGLILEPRRDNDLESKVWVPVQKFIAAESALTSNSLNYDLYGKSEDLEQFSNYNLQNKSRALQRLRPQNFLEYQLLDDKLQFASKPHLLLFIYLLLGQRKFSVAHKYTQQYLTLGGFIGNAHERSIIEMCLFALPFSQKFGAKEFSSEMYSNNPYYILVATLFTIQLAKFEKSTSSTVSFDSEGLVLVLNLYFRALPNIPRNLMLDGPNLASLLPLTFYNDAIIATLHNKFVMGQSYIEPENLLAITTLLRQGFANLAGTSPNPLGQYAARNLVFSKYQSYVPKAVITNPIQHVVNVSQLDLTAVFKLVMPCNPFLQSLRKIVQQRLPANFDKAGTMKNLFNEIFAAKKLIGSEGHSEVKFDVYKLADYVLYCALHAPAFFKKFLEVNKDSHDRARDNFVIILNACELLQAAQFKLPIESAEFGLIHYNKLLLADYTGTSYHNTAFPANDELDLPPVIAKLEKMQNIALRAEQRELIQNFARANNNKPQSHAAQLIMGGGKTAVIAPCLAYLETAHNQLFLFVVPKSLLSSTAERLAATSANIFGQAVHKLEFTRHYSNNDAQYKAILQTLYTAIATRSYVITTPESLSALELTWIDQLNNGADYATIAVLEKIIFLFKSRGVALFDETHQTLCPRQEVNFAVNAKKNIATRTIRHTLELYSILEHVMPEGSNCSLLNQLRSESILVMDEKWTATKLLIAQTIVKHCQLTLLPNNAANLLEIQGKLLAYLCSDPLADISFMTALDDDSRNKFALFKQQLQILLPLTLSKKVQVRYGPGTGDADPSTAIPFDGNNNPKLGSDFASHFEIANYTVQMSLINGLRLEDMQIFVSNMQKKALEEKRLSCGKINNLEETRIAQLFAKLCNGRFELFDLDIKHIDAYFMSFHQTMRHDNLLVRYCLQTIILPRINYYGTMLRHNEQNVMSMFAIVQGFSGTINSAYVFREDLKFDTAAAKEVGLRTNELLIRKNTKVCTDIDAAFNINTRAFIDLGALNSGVPNHIFAKQLISIIQKQQIDLKYVLFYDEDNNLCAMTVAEPNKQAIFIGSSAEENIQKTLQCTPEQRFTYYDQTHFTGADIVQMDNASAVVTLDYDSTNSDLQQACMRMRKLACNQECIIVVSEKLHNLHGDTWTINDIMQYSAEAQTRQLRDDNFKIALHKIHNVVRAEILGLILSSLNLEYKRKLIKDTYQIIYSEIPDVPFLMFGKIDCLMNTSKVIADYATHLLELIRAIDTALAAKLHDKLFKIVDRAISELPELILASKSSFDSTVHIEATQSVTEIESSITQQQTEVSMSLQNVLNKGLPYHNWIDLQALLRCQHSPANPELRFLDVLHATVLKKDQLLGFSFSDTAIGFSQNFFHFDAEDPLDVKDSNRIGLYGRSQKQINFVLWLDYGSEQRAIIITDEEARNLRKQFLSEAVIGVDLKIVTLSGYIFYSHAPTLLIDNQHLLEQLNFLNGNVAYLIENIESLHWLPAEPGAIAAKIEFLRNKIIGYKYATQLQFETLQKIIATRFFGTTDEATDELQQIVHSFRVRI